MYKPLIQKAASPDPALAHASENEQTLARLAHVNKLAKYIGGQMNDIGFYEVPFTGPGLSVQVNTTKGIIDFEMDGPFDTDTVNPLEVFIYLPDQAYTPDPHDYYIQLTVYSNGAAVPVAWSAGANPALHVKIQDVSGASSNIWGTRFYLYYEIVKRN